VLRAGADFQLLRTPTTTELEAKYVLEPTRITGSTWIYFRSSRGFAAGGQWSWLGTRIFIAFGIRLPGELQLDVFTVG
jgi:hypothetical protein